MQAQNSTVKSPRQHGGSLKGWNEVLERERGRRPTPPAARVSDEATAFLQVFDPTGRHNLFAIMPGGPVEGCTFDAGDVERIAAWIDERHATHNLYFSQNEPRTGAPNAKLGKGDIAYIRSISVDLDLPAGEDYDVARKAVKDRLRKAVKEDGLPQPTLVVDSGNGLQAHWLLEEKVTVEAMQSWAEAEGRAFAQRLGGDATHNVDRVLRLPGTLNIPNAKKRALGRRVRPTQVIAQIPARYKVLALSNAVPPISNPPPGRLAGDSELDARILQVMDDIAGYDDAGSFDELDASLRAKFNEALTKVPALAKLWAGEPPEDNSGSGFRWALAGLLGRSGMFEASEFAALAWAWPHAHGNQPLSARSLARDWVRNGEKFQREVQSLIEPIEGGINLPKGAAAVSAVDDPGRLPVRQFVIEPLAQRGSTGQIVGEPGISKSTFALNLALAVATGQERVIRGSGGSVPLELHRYGPVIFYDAEDQLQEMRKRLRAAQLHYGIVDLAHPIYLWSGADGSGLTVLERTSTAAGSALAPAAGLTVLRQMVLDTGAIMVILGPQVGLLRGGTENSTDDMEALLQTLGREAAALDVSMLLIHHTAKSTRDHAGDMGAGRGAFSAVAKVRSMATLTNVTDDEAAKWGYSERGLIKLDFGKASYSQKPALPTVMRRVSVPIGNGSNAPLTDNSVFPGSPAERLHAAGDRAPVLEIIGLGVPTAGSETAVADAERERRNTIARAVLAVVGDAEEVRLADHWEAIASELKRAHLTKSNSRTLIVDMLKIALVGQGEQAERDGQLVRIVALQDGLGPKAPWKLVITPVGDAGHASDANSGMFA